MLSRIRAYLHLLSMTCACACTCIACRTIRSCNSEALKQPSEGDRGRERQAEGVRSSQGWMEGGGGGGAGRGGQGTGKTEDGVHVSQ